MPSDMTGLVLDAAQGDVVAQLLLEISEPVSISEATHAVAALHSVDSPGVPPEVRDRLADQWLHLLESSLSGKGEVQYALASQQLTVPAAAGIAEDLDLVHLSALLEDCSTQDGGQEGLLLQLLVEREWTPEMLGAVWALTLYSPERCESLRSFLPGSGTLSQQWLCGVLRPLLQEHPQWRSRVLRGLSLMLAAIESPAPPPPSASTPGASLRSGRVHRVRLLRHSPPPLLSAESVLEDPPRRRRPARQRLR